MKKLSLLFAVLLAGCGSGSVTSTTPTEPANPEPDAFFTQILALVSATPEDAEAASIETMEASAPDNREAETL